MSGTGQDPGGLRPGDDEIISGNLAEVSERQKKLNKLRISQAYEILGRIRPVIEQPIPVAEIVGAASLAFRESDRLGRFSTKDKVLLCRRLTSLLLEAGRDPGELIFPAPAPAVGDIVAFVGNQFSAAAYEIFASHLVGAEQRIYNSFTEMCDDTSSGSPDACIIPIENTQDGKLLSFYSLIDRSDLKISTICDVYSEDESRRTRYALLRRTLTRPSGAGKLYFEFSFSPTPGFTVDEMLHAAVISGLVIYRIDSIPLRYSESNFIFHPVLLGSIENILTYAVFLSFSSAQYAPVGLSALVT